jgi:alkylresorcinol/alkylpyrone synthase
MAYIHSVTTHFPSHEYEQEKILEICQTLWPRHQSTIRTLGENVGVSKRHLALPLDQYPSLKGMKKRNEVWLNTAMELTTTAIKTIISNSKIDLSTIGAIFTTSITGLSIPSLEARLMNVFDFPQKIKRIPLFGLGCLAGVAGINRCADYLKAYPREAALLIANEFCSLTWQQQDTSMANLVGTLLFGDGCGVVLMVGDEHPLAKKAVLKILHHQSTFFRNTETMMGWNIGDDGFELVLSNKVPEIVGTKFNDEYMNFKKNFHINEDPQFYIMHPGGPKVLLEMEKTFNLLNKELRHSWESLKDCANMSSVSVLDVLKRTLAENTIHGHGLMTAMGPGFCAEFSFLQRVNE